MKVSYKNLLEDINVLGEYKKVDEYQKNYIENHIADHGINHIKRVICYVNILSKLLEFNKDFQNDCLIATVLHDLGMSLGKAKHAENSAKLAKEILNNYKEIKNKEQIIDAISKHSLCEDCANDITLVISLADKLDITYHRVGFAGFKMPGMRQLRYINKINITRDKKILKFKFLVSKYFDKKEFEGFYFYKKVISSIINFCNRFKMEGKIVFRRG